MAANASWESIVGKMRKLISEVSVTTAPQIRVARRAERLGELAVQ
jgi:hypothetical protein